MSRVQVFYWDGKAVDETEEEEEEGQILLNDTKGLMVTIVTMVDGDKE